MPFSILNAKALLNLIIIIFSKSFIMYRSFEAICWLILTLTFFVVSFSSASRKMPE